MGQFLCIGLNVKIVAEKKRMGNDPGKIEQAKRLLEEKLSVDGLYECVETEDCYVYSLKPELLEQELLPFLKNFYQIRYSEKDSRDEKFVLESLSACSTPEEWMKIAKEKRFESYQMDVHEVYVNTGTFRSYFYARVQNILLSMDGKIIMECYESLLRFFTECIKERLHKFRLANALEVYISL